MDSYTRKMRSRFMLQGSRGFFFETELNQWRNIQKKIKSRPSVDVMNITKSLCKTWCRSVF